MADLSNDDVLRILELIDKSQFDYLQLTLGDLQLTVSKEGVPPGTAGAPTLTVQSTAAAPPLPAAAPQAPAAPPAVAPAAAAAPPAAPAAAAPAPPAAAADPSLIDVPAPMVGTFYRAPDPTAPPFVEVGSAVEPETTMALVEAMKVFTGVLAGVRGTVVAVLAENAQFVEYGQPLFRVRPHDAAGA